MVRSITLRSVEVLKAPNNQIVKNKILKKLNDVEKGKIICADQILLKYLQVLKIIKSQFLNFNPQYITIKVELKAITYQYEKNNFAYCFLEEIRPDGNGFALLGPSKLFLHKSCLPGNNFNYLPRQKVWNNSKTGKEISPSNSKLLNSKITQVSHSETKKNNLKLKCSLKIPYGGDLSWY